MKKITAILATTAIFALSGVGVANAVGVAQTRALATGNTLYAIDCETSTGQLAKINVLTGVATAVGTGMDTVARPDIDCASQAAWAPGTRTAYWVSAASVDHLERINLDTGVSTDIGALTIGGSTSSGFRGLAMGPSNNLYVIYWVASASEMRLGSVDLNTATVTDIGLVESGNGNYYSFAYNPADQKFYVAETATKKLYEIDVTSGAKIDKGAQFNGRRIWGMAFDQAGTIFTTSWNDVTTFTIPGWTTENLQGTSVGTSTAIRLGSNMDWYSQSVFTTYPVSNGSSSGPSLAATGTNSTVIAGVIAGAVGLLLSGLGITVSTRRRRM